MQRPEASAEGTAATAAARLDARCPLCRAQGESSTFAEVFMCVTDSCRVWTYEAGPAEPERTGAWPPRAELMRRRERPPC